MGHWRPYLSENEVFAILSKVIGYIYIKVYDQFVRQKCAFTGLLIFFFREFGCWCAQCAGAVCTRENVVAVVEDHGAGTKYFSFLFWFHSTHNLYVPVQPRNEQK